MAHAPSGEVDDEVRGSGKESFAANYPGAWRGKHRGLGLRCRISQLGGPRDAVGVGPWTPSRIVPNQ